MPLCAACLFAEASRRAWRTKAPPRRIRKDSDKPGDHASCDHLISHEPGLIPQVTGRLTYKDMQGQPFTRIMLPSILILI